MMNLKRKEKKIRNDLQNKNKKKNKQNKHQ